MHKTIEKIVYPGKSLIRDQKVILTDEGLPGEEVEVETVKERPNLIEARTVKIVSPSPQRVTPACSHYKICSPYQYIAYDAQVKIKEGQLKEIFSRLGDLDIAFAPCAKTFNYRNKMNFLVRDVAGALVLAYNQINDPQNFQAIDSCALADKTLDNVAHKTLEVLNREALSMVKEITLRATSLGNKVLVLHVEGKPETEKIAQAFSSLHSELKITIALHAPQSVTIMHGPKDIREKAGGAIFHLGPLSFFQINLPMLEAVIADMKKFLPLNSTMRIADLYCGVGTLALSLGKNSEKVIMVEAAQENTAYLEQNIHENKIVNAQSYFGQVERWLNKLKNDRLDIVIVDPPRAGLDKETTHRLLQLKPSFIAYLSCDPMTLKRDLEILKTHYKVTKLRGYDFFPQTPHLETLAVLALR